MPDARQQTRPGAEPAQQEKNHGGDEEIAHEGRDIDAKQIEFPDHDFAACWKKRERCA